MSEWSEWRFIWPYLWVGFLGFCLNMGVLTLALYFGLPVKPALAFGIAASTLSAFFLDRHMVFSHARGRDLLQQFGGFIVVCLLGAALNYICATTLLYYFPTLLPHVAEWFGILVGTTFNYLLLRFWVFHHRDHREH